jgi:RimJ/RimL family protein N-acetyltransferase
VSQRPSVRLKPWAAGDQWLLERLLGDPTMMEHLGGPESPEQIRKRQARYLTTVGQFRIELTETGEGVGWVGYWERSWNGEDVYEIGWSVLPEFQRRWIAAAATRQAIEATRSEGERRFVHAFPSVDNPPSNAICRKLGFTLLEAVRFEYPRGHFMQCNDWRLELHI